MKGERNKFQKDHLNFIVGYIKYLLSEPHLEITVLTVIRFDMGCDSTMTNEGRRHSNVYKFEYIRQSLKREKLFNNKNSNNPIKANK